MVITRKIELRCNKEDFQTVKKWSNLMPRLHNQIVTNIFLNDIIKDKFTLHNERYRDKIRTLDEKIKTEYDKLTGLKDEKKRKTGLTKIEKLKKDRSKFNVEAKKEFDTLYKEAFGHGVISGTYEYICSDEIFEDLPNTIIDSAINNLKFYIKDVWKIKSGEERIRMYSKGMPIPARRISFNIFSDKDINKFTLKWFKGMEFEMFFGRDKSNNRVMVERVLDGTYKISDSSIQLKKGKIFLNMCINIPENNNKFEDGRVVGVDLGLSIPAYCSVNDSQERLSIGSYDDFIKIRTQLQKRRQNLQKSLVLSKGGHGRKRKLKALESLNEKERNWVKTYNHKISKAIIDFALKNKAEQINLEFLKGYGNRESNDFVLRNWSYFELQQFIEYKAKIEGIQVAYIDPYHTSQTCHICGNYESGQRVSQSKFVCKSCGEELNADYNASKNIAISNKYVTSKSQCEYFKK